MDQFGALLGFTLLGESLQPYHAAGAALVFTGIVLTQYGQARARRGQTVHDFKPSPNRG